MKRTALFLLVILSFIAYKKAATIHAAPAAQHRAIDIRTDLSPESSAFSNTEK